MYKSEALPCGRLSPKLGDSAIEDRVRGGSYPYFPRLLGTTPRVIFDHCPPHLGQYILDSPGRKLLLSRGRQGGALKDKVAKHPRPRRRGGAVPGNRF